VDIILVSAVVVMVSIPWPENVVLVVALQLPIIMI
jgi:hypothetical protein